MNELLGGIETRKKEEQHRKEEEERLRQEQLFAEEQRRQEKVRAKEEQRKAEKRRKTEDLRGPRIWTCCHAQDHLIQEFDRAALHVALGPESYITLWDYAKGHSWSGIPTALRNKLNGRTKSLASADLIALGACSGHYYVRFGDGASQWEGPDDFTDAIQSKGGCLSIVVLGPCDSWFLQWTDGSWQSMNLPTTLCNMLTSNGHRSVAFLSIAAIDIDDYNYINDAAWFLRWSDDRHPVWKLHNSPSNLNERIN